MTIEEYLNTNGIVYNWEEITSFNHGNRRYFVFYEISPSFQREQCFLYEEDGMILNCNDDVVVDQDGIINFEVVGME